MKRCHAREFHRICAGLAVIILLATAALAEPVPLNNGSVLNGEVSNVTAQGFDLRLSYGAAKYSWSQVDLRRLPTVNPRLFQQYCKLTGSRSASTPTLVVRPVVTSPTAPQTPTLTTGDTKVSKSGRAASVASSDEDVRLLGDPDQKAFRLWLSYPPEKILKNQALPDKKRADRISLTAAKGEFESFALLLRPFGRGALMDLRFEFEPESGGPSSPLSLEWQRISYINIDQASGDRAGATADDEVRAGSAPFGLTQRTGWFPDRLIPDSVSVAAVGENTQFWFTLHIAENARFGVHRGTIVLKFRGSDPLRIPVEVSVYDFALPRKTSLRCTSCWSPQYLDKLWSNADIKALYRDMVLHRQTPDPILPQPEVSVGKDGTVKVDTKDYDEVMSYCLDELGISHFFFPRVGLFVAGGNTISNVYFLWQTPQLRQQKWYGIQIFDDSWNLTPEFQKTFGAYVKTMMEHFRQKGWLEKARLYMTTMDEPAKPDDFVAIRNFGKFVKSVAPEVRLFCTIYPRSELMDVIDAWCPQKYDEAEVRARQAAGNELMFYKNWLHLIDTPMVNTRLYGWITWRTRASGWLTYATMGNWNRAWDEPYLIYPNGTKVWGIGLWWYPDMLQPRILKSVRWEMMREGAEDYEYLRILADRVASIPTDRKGLPEAKAAQQFLDKAAEKVLLYPRVIPAGPDGGWESWPNYVMSNKIVWELRNEAARHIEALGPIGRR